MKTRTVMTIAAALTMLASVGCKKQETTSPDDANVEDEDDDEDDAEPDDADADTDDAEPESVLLTKAGFDETINDHMQEISDCYVGLLADNPDLKGHLDAEFTIDADGTATAVIAAEGSTLNDENLMSCISGAAAGWSFDKPAEPEMKLRYQFDLAPAE